MKLRSLKFTQKNRFLFTFLLLVSMLFAGQGVTFGQKIGDYRSNATTGNWTSLAAWSIWNGTAWITPTTQGYPGQNAGTGDVTILTGHTINIGSEAVPTGITTQPMGTVTVQSNAFLNLWGSKNSSFTFFLNTMEINVIPTPITGSIVFHHKAVLELPANSIIRAGIDPNGAFGLSGDCNNHQEIWIGTQKFSVCNGAGGTATFTFLEFMEAGGTLNAITSLNSTTCAGGTINISGNYSGAIGTTVPNGSIAGVAYSWLITDPYGATSTVATQNVSITNAIYDPPYTTYTVALTVTTYAGTYPFTNTETITVDVDPLPLPAVTGDQDVSSNESGIVYTTDPGMTGYTWTVTGGTIASGAGTNTITVNWGAAGPGEVTVTYTNLNGCSAASPTVWVVDIRDKVTVKDGIWAASDTWDPPGAPKITIPDITVKHIVNVDASELANCFNMTIDAGAVVQVDPGSQMTVGGNITNNAGSSGLVLKADNTGAMGSLIHNNASEGTVEQFLQYSPQVDESWQWHLVSSPISDGIINTYFDMYLYEYDETQSGGSYWINLWDPVTTPLNVGQGYIVTGSNQYVGETTATFATHPGGHLNYSDVSYTGFTMGSPDPAFTGFELIGNPFPCALDWNASWNQAAGNISGWMSVMDNTGTYRSYHTDGTGVNGGTSIIPSTQGFFVRATSLPASLTIPASQRVHDGQPFYKEAEEYIYPIVRLEAGTSEFTDECVVVFHPEGNTGFDDYYDLAKFTNSDGMPNIYSVSEDLKYAFNMLPENYQDAVIPIHFKIISGGIYQVRASEINNFPQGANVYLQDLKTGSLVKLEENATYDFTYSPADDTHRFNLVFKQSTISFDEPVEERTLLVYAAEDIIYISMPEANTAKVVIYDLMGREILSRQITGQNRAEINLNAETGYYVVKVQTSDQFVTEKVFVK